MCGAGGGGVLCRRVNAIVRKERNTVPDESIDLNYIIPVYMKGCHFPDV
jgi:hypothetical protein